MRHFLLVFALLVAPLAAQQPRPDLLFTRFESYLEALRVQAGIPGLAAAIVGRSEIAWERGFGHQNLARSLPATPSTPFYLDDVTQVFTASLVLRCVEEGHLSLNDRLDRFAAAGPEGNVTIAQALSHLSASTTGPVYAPRPDRLEWLKPAIRACTGDSFRETVSNLLASLAMVDSVPGLDAIRLVPPAPGIPDLLTAERYALALGRLATPYAVAWPGRSSPTEHPVTTLGAAGGLIASVRDMAQFDLALKNEVFLRSDTLALAWSRPAGGGTQPLPHGLGWFVQTYNGEKIIWQFGLTENASSSLLISVPSEGLSLIMLANSDGLARWFPLAAGDVTVSPFARVFLGLVVP